MIVKLHPMRMALLLALVGLLPFAGARAADRVWKAASSTTGNWFTAANWDGGLTWPAAGDTVTITNGFVLLTNSTAALAAFSITNARLIFSNWNTKLDATNVTVMKNGYLTLPAVMYMPICGDMLKCTVRAEETIMANPLHHVLLAAADMAGKVVPEKAATRRI